MSKIAKYLNEHLSGEVLLNKQALGGASQDAGVLLKEPEMIANVANTSDIRKVTRFAWQLAEKGHVLPITVRGQGSSANGSSVGPGLILSMVKYMNRIVGVDTKQHLVHVQAGASNQGVNLALSTHRGLTLPGNSFDYSASTIGGSLSSGAVGRFSARYGTFGSAAKQVEVVLANGDVLQTARLNKRELNAKKGLHTMEGDIYRQIDNLITDNADLVKSLSRDATFDTVGYRSITQVKQKDGSFDLTPLFVGSQGTLGIITEAIMQAQFNRQDFSVLFASFDKMPDVHSAADKAREAKAASVEMIDGRLLERATLSGKKRDFAPEDSFKGGLMVAIFDDYSQKARNKAARKLYRQLEGAGALHLSTKSYSLSELPEIYSWISLASVHEGATGSGVYSGFWLPLAGIDSFLTEISNIEKAHGLELPAVIDARSGYIDLFPLFDLKKVSDRQKLVKTLALLADVVGRLNGSIAGYGGEGRIKALMTRSHLESEVVELYDQIKNIFDPHGVLNPGVKQEVSAKDVVSQLNAWCRLSA